MDSMGDENDGARNDDNDGVDEGRTSDFAISH